MLARHDVGVDEFPCERGSPLGTAASGAHADELGIGVSARTQERDRVVGVVADVGIDPEAHRQRRNTESSAPSRSGCANSNPLDCSFALDTRWLPRSVSTSSPPNTTLSPTMGVG